jgi:streptogramin lyase
VIDRSTEASKPNRLRSNTLWFAEPTGNKVGTIEPITYGLTEAPVPTDGSSVRGIAAGPDDKLLCPEMAKQKPGALTSALVLSVTVEPPPPSRPTSPSA